VTGIDPAKLADWYAAWGGGLVLYARQWVDPAGAEDAVQEVFVRLMAQPAQPANVKAWLYLATRNAAVAAGRSVRRRARWERAVAERVGPLFEADPAGRIDAAAAEAALAELPPGLREVVVLRVWGGMTLAEVAAVTGGAVSTVFDQYRAAIARVRKSLEPSWKANETNQAKQAAQPGGAAGTTGSRPARAS